ncbi:MAG: hypothetical protein AN483_06910 [Aphanizomenon flos-aquae MDT14a]|jgi:hypothetical protein|uniref:Uncharacterized protein n=1 Tax=Aphanizomenon flos-aquae WA102 TaxID=1710896 RepID=A0A1B7WT35_APHFL|nr:MAG: hypothetical protein AN483_06910 [Aphanizomenon flos-aquae MDT14a]OBQ40262.1 MAG: hypothetical protein AN484_22575 [Aphanizomenon flos-aquae WA102]
MSLPQKLKLNGIVVFMSFMSALIVLAIIILMLVQQGIGLDGFIIIIFCAIVIFMLVTRPRTK